QYIHTHISKHTDTSTHMHTQTSVHTHIHHCTHRQKHTHTHQITNINPHTGVHVYLSVCVCVSEQGFSSVYGPQPGLRRDRDMMVTFRFWTRAKGGVTHR